MDEDLKIVLTSELEADEQASARRISAQLPNIAKLINSKSNIKVGVTLDESTIQAQTQKLAQQITRATKTQGIGVSLSLDQSSVNKIRTELNNLKVNPDISRTLTDQLDQMGVRIDKISGRWEAVNREQERMLNLTIQGTDQMGRTVTYLQTYDTKTGKINTHLTNVTANLEKQRNVQEQLAKQAKADNESRVLYLTKQQALLADIQATYAGATSAKPVTDDAHLSELNNTYSAINAQIQNMIANEGKLDSVQRSNLEAQISGLKRMVKEYQNAEYVATKLRTKTVGEVNAGEVEKLAVYEQKLRDASILTETFQNRIAELRTQLGGAFDSSSLTAYLNNFDRLSGEVDSFKARIQSVDSLYQKLGAVSTQIASIQKEMLKTDPSSKKYAGLARELELRQQEETSLGRQIAAYQDIVQYSNLAAQYEMTRLNLQAQIATSEGAVADTARQIAASMSTVGTSVDLVEAKFRALSNPTDELREKVANLRTLMDVISNSSSNSEQVALFKQLNQEIAQCNKQITSLNGQSRLEIVDPMLESKLQKAKADLATVGRQWSALKTDPGLNAQFLQLQENLKCVNSQMDLNKWTAQFSAFKSEVKAAGKNMQSLGDILKNNVSKVLQWVSATTLLFRAFRLLKNALSTVVSLDTAMIDLQKVTTATRVEYDRFYYSANDTAKALGVTTEEIISQTAEWARLGYAMQDAAKLAENSAIFASISPDMDITQATDGLVSIIKAYGFEAEDSLDGVISKINEIGNKFAVSNGDIVEAMTRTSSAMAAANNTFEETVALATAAIEITRDAASVGNGLKTLSMRIRGYDEETEEYSEDIAILTGKIADLTKVASNNNAGISLFEPGDPDTYRSTYDILSDIADIWDELTDKNRATLLETLFGKRQAQIGAAILSNFDQARSAIKEMEESAGSANREMEKIEQSLEYKLNALQETWVGVAQNLFKTDDLKIVVDGLIALSEVIDGLTDILGLFGTAGLIVAIAGLIRFQSTVSSIKTTVTPVLQSLSNVNYDKNTESVLRYATALSALDPVQQKLAMNLLGLNKEQQEQIVTMMAATAALKQYNVAELEQALGMQAGEISRALNIASTAMVTEEVLKAAMANGVLTEAQLAAIVSTNSQTAANTAGATSFVTLGAAAKAAGATMMATPMGWISLLIGLLPLAITGVTKLYDWLVVTAEEAYESAEEYRKAYDEINEEVDDLNAELEESKERLTELRKLSNAGTITIIEQEELERLQKVNAELETTISRKRELAEMEAADANKDYVASYNKTSFASNSQDRYLTEQAALYEQYGDLLEKYYNYQALPDSVTWLDGELEKATEVSNRLFEIKNILESGYDSESGTWLTESQDYATHVEDLVNTYNELNSLQENGVILTASQNDLLESTRAELVGLADQLDEDYLSRYIGKDEHTEEWQRLLDMINKTIYATEYFGQKLTELPSDCYNAMAELGQGAQLSAEKVTELADKFPELQMWMDESGYTAENVAAHFNALLLTQEEGAESASGYTAKLTELTDVLSDLQTSYDVLKSAQEDMAGGGGLSVDTIEDLAGAEENYLDYLYEENGVVKLNTEAWKENTNAKMKSEMAEIQKEIDSLEKQNAVLQENIDLYNEKAYSSDSIAEMDHYFSLVNAATAEIKENTSAIEENQAKLALYSSLYGSITGDLNVYSSALANFSNVSNTIDSISSSFQTLANLQAEVANGFTMSLDKALEFAKVYPEILNSAQVSADGQIMLNEGVVNSFIEGKKAELDAEVDSQIAILESKKSVFEAQLAFSQAELELAQSVGEGEGQIAKEVAEFRLDTANQLVAALIEAGVDEATAFQLACAAMAGNAEEFDRIAMEVCTDVNGNFNEAAYKAAQAIYENMNSAKKDVASLATQAQQTAEAIAGMADGVKKGSAAIVGGSGGGKQTSGITLNLTGADFKGTDYAYESKSLSLEDFISDLELDISNYRNAISQIDGQIAALQALKNTPLKNFQSSGSSSGSGSGSNSGSSSSTQDVEEYIASIDEYREAVERLRKVQEEADKLETAIDNAGSFEKKIELQEKLIAAYREEQAALHNLNDMRDSTITQGVKSLRELGFAVQYNADTNDLWIENLEHLNELTADSAGEYGSLQEATNALREGTEDLIDTITELNDANREGSESWWDLNRNIIETTVAMYENMIQARKNIAMLAENGMDNAIDTKNLADVKKFSTAMIAEYQNMQKILHQEAEYYRSLGYSDTSDEVSALSDLWWDYADNIKSVKEQVVDYLIDIVDAAHDAVDEIQNVSDTLYEAADEFVANDGFITVDTYQALLQLGPQYMQMLKDENGLWQINEERINDVIAAQTRQLAVENALSYVERLKLAAQEGSIEDLNNLCFATTDATASTWGLVYAELELMHTMGELNDSQYQAALYNIQAMQDLAENAVQNIGKATNSVATNLEETRNQLEKTKDGLQDLLDELENMQDGANDLIKYVMDMLKHRINEQIDLLEEMKDKYSEIIQLKKDSLDVTKDEQNYQKEISKKLKEMAKLQERINALSLDDSRAAQAERASLLEQLAELQEDLADTQADKSIEAQKEALDQMEEDYHEEKDKEIEILEDSISSYQKLYDMAINYIHNNWDTLYSELIAWNYEYGSVLNSEITEAWEAAQAAAQRYGDFVSAVMGGISAEIDSITRQIEALNDQISNLSTSTSSSGSTIVGASSNKNTVVSTQSTSTSPTSEDMVKSIVSRMKEYSAAWSTRNDRATNDALHQKAVALAQQLDQYGVHADYRDLDGTWWITKDDLNPSNVGKLLHSCYHTGGFIGDEPLKPNEQYIKAENGELMMTSSQQDSLAAQIDRISAMADVLASGVGFGPTPVVGGGLSQAERGTINNITNNSRPIEINVGDTIIQGNANTETVAAHSKMTEKMVNDLARMVGVKW